MSTSTAANGGGNYYCCGPAKKTSLDVGGITWPPNNEWPPDMTPGNDEYPYEGWSGRCPNGGPKIKSFRPRS